MAAGLPKLRANLKPFFSFQKNGFFVSCDNSIFKKGRAMVKRQILISIFLLVSLLLGPNVHSSPGNLATIPPTLNPYYEKEIMEFAEEEILVRFREGVSKDEIASLNEEVGAFPYKVFSFPNGLKIYHLKLEQRKVKIHKALGDYNRSSATVYATPNYKLFSFNSVEPQLSPNDPYFEDQWALDNRGQNGGQEDADISALEAWFRSTGNKKVVIAVVDTGVQIDHPDLISNIWTNPGEIPNNGIDDDNNGYIDDVHGWDFKNDDNSVYDRKDWHGTHVAGIIGAVGNNSQGIAGVNWQVNIMPLKFLEYGVGTTSEAIEALAYAANMGAKIISNSWGRWGAPDPAMEDAIRSSEALCLFAAGNYRKDNDAGYPNLTTYPASYPLGNIISVAASDSSDNLVNTRFWGTNWGRTTVDMAAPGLDILSLLPTDKAYPPYAYASGTSMATPYVAGVAGLLKGLLPARSPEQIKKIILENIDTNPDLQGYLFAGGRLNAANCLAKELDGIAPEVGLTVCPPTKLIENIPTIEAHFEWQGSDNVTPKERLLYSYFMKGYDEEWSSWSPEKSTNYLLSLGEYTFKVRACDEAGNIPEEESSLTAKFSFEVLLPLIVYPNPFRSGQTLTIANISSGSNNTEVLIYDITGTLIKVLREGTEIQNKGCSLTATWNGCNRMGVNVARGIYFYIIYDGTTSKEMGKIAVTD